MSAGRPALVPVGIFGGTFDPVHFGHLRSALELVEHLGLQQVRMVPCAVPPHRALPGCSATHRAAMLELAVAGAPGLVCDRRELRRPGPSYTIDSLIELNDELGPDCSLSLVMGCDAVLGLDRWHRWRELLDWAHLVVIARPGWSLPDEGPVAQWLGERERGSAGTLQCQPAGTLIVEQLRPLAISATEIRELLLAGRSARYLMPEPVLDYIHQHGLYRRQRS